MNAITKFDERQVVNGIDVGAVQQLAEAVAADKAKGMTNWRVATQWQGQTWSRTRGRGFRHGRRDRSPAISRSISTSRSNCAARTASPTRRNICWRRSMPA